MYAVLPKGAKPSRALSRDQTRPLLMRAELAQVGDGWELWCTDSYQLARVPLDVYETKVEPALTPGAISADALKAIEKRGAGAFTANGHVEVLDANGKSTGQTFTRDCPGALGPYPKVEQLMPVDPAQPFTLRFDPKILWDLANALGASGGPQHAVELTVDLAHAQDGDYGRAIVVSVKNGQARGLLMPVRKA